MLPHYAGYGNYDMLLLVEIITILAVSITVLWLSVLTYLVIRTLNKKSPVHSMDHKETDVSFGLNKYNPFPDTGGDQSFTISLLNGVGNGILLTSLHARGATRLYAKEVHLGHADQELSSEEKQALNKALTYEKK
jgi:hypothetical protein